MVVEPVPKALVVVNVQNDFMKKDGKAYVPGACDIVENVKKLIRKAVEVKLPVVLIADVHKETDKSIIGEHCVEKTEGARLVDGLVLTGVFVLEKNGIDGATDAEVELMQFFGCNGGRIYIAGVPIEYDIADLSAMFLDLGFDVCLAVDAARGYGTTQKIDGSEGRLETKLLSLGANGVMPLTTEEIIIDMEEEG